MGRKVSDGKAFDAVAPASQVINDGDLYRIAGWTGSAIGQKDGVQTDRAMSFEMDTDAIYSILAPVGLAPTVGEPLFWATNDGTTFQRGDANLVAAGAAGQLPCFRVLVAKNAAGYIQGRIEQS